MAPATFCPYQQGVPLGILRQTTFTYDEMREKRGQGEVCVRGINKDMPIEQKASYRWIDQLTAVSQAIPLDEGEFDIRSNNNSSNKTSAKN